MHNSHFVKNKYAPGFCLMRGGSCNAFLSNKLVHSRFLKFNLIKVRCRSTILPSATRLFYQSGFCQVIQGSLYGRAGETYPGGNGVNPRPAGALLIRMILEINEHGLCPGVQFSVLIDRVVIGQCVSHPLVCSTAAWFFGHCSHRLTFLSASRTVSIGFLPG